MIKKAVMTLISLMLSNFNLAYGVDFSYLDSKNEIPKHFIKLVDLGDAQHLNLVSQKR